MAVLVAFPIQIAQAAYDVNWFWYGDTRTLSWNTWIPVNDYIQMYLYKYKNRNNIDVVQVIFQSDTMTRQSGILFHEVWRVSQSEPSSTSWVTVRFSLFRTYDGGFTCVNCGDGVSVNLRELPNFKIRVGLDRSFQPTPEPEPEPEPTPTPTPEPEPEPEPIPEPEPEPKPPIFANNPFKNLIDNIFSLPESIIELVKGKLVGASTLVAQGIDISAWLAPVSLLGPEWVRVINALLAGATLVFTFWIAKKVYSLYLEYKQGVKWW